MGRIKDSRRDSFMRRQCEACGRGAWGAFCDIHRRRRGLYGHVKLSGLPVCRPGYRGGRRRREWQDLLPLAHAYITKNPLTPEIAARLQQVLDPGVPPPPTMKPKHPRAVLWKEQAWWQNPRARKGRPRHPRIFRDHYSPEAILGNLLAAQVYLEERHAFPGEAEACSLAFVLASQWKRRKLPSGRSLPLMPTTRRLLAQKVKDGVGLWLITSAREILKSRASQQQVLARVPSRPQPPPPSLYVPPPPRDRVAEMLARYGVVVKNS